MFLQDLSPRQLMAAGYVGAASTVVAGCSVVALIKFRVIHKILPKSVADKLDNFVEKIAEKTAPRGMTKMATMQNKIAYLQSVYGQATLGFLLGGMGTYLFTKLPRMPILPAIIGTGISFGLLSLAPRKLLTPKQRQATFALCCICGGVSLGPMNWIARETNSCIFASAISTTVAFTLTPLITRGWIANAFLNQALSSSLALLSVKFIALRTFSKLNHNFASPDVPLGDKLVEFITTPLEMDGLLLVQAIGNAVLVGVHSYPVLSGLRETSEGIDCLDEVSAQRDALMVVGSVAFATFKLFQSSVEFVARAIKAGAQKDKKKAVGDVVQAAVKAESNTMINQLSAGVSTLTFFVLYVKFVQRLQQCDDPAERFRWLTKIFSQLTPVRLATYRK